MEKKNLNKFDWPIKKAIVCDLHTFPRVLTIPIQPTSTVLATVPKSQMGQCRKQTLGGGLNLPVPDDTDTNDGDSVSRPPIDGRNRTIIGYG